MQAPSNYAFTLQSARGLMALMQPLTGTRATGEITVTAAAGQSVALPIGSYCYPVIDGSARPELLFKTTAAATITDAGVEVAVASNLGGERFNIAAGTEFVFDPFVDDLAARPGADVPRNTLAFTGGLAQNDFGCLRDVVLLEELTGPIYSPDVARSAITRFPAALVTWESTEPADGSSTAQTTRATRTSNSTQLYKVNFDIAIMTTRQDSASARRSEGLTIVDTLMALMLDRHMVDSVALSNPAGVQLRRAYREEGADPFYRKFYVYRMGVSVESSCSTIEFRTFSDWLLANLQLEKPQTPAVVNQGDLTLVDTDIDMS